MSVDLIIGGASKAGTTAVFDILRQSHNFFFPDKKELHYFSYHALSKTTEGPGDAYVMNEIPRTFEQYISYFSKKKDNQVSVDVSPSYLFHSGAAVEISEKLPDARVLFILRRPDEKIYSQYLHLVGEGRETLSFEDALKKEPERKRNGYSDMWLYRESGYYSSSISYFLRVLGSDKVKVILFDDFRDNPSAVLRDICLFVGLDSSHEFDTNIASNVSGKPRSWLLAKIMAPNGFTCFMRRVLPNSIGRGIRRVLRNINTGAKPELTQDTRTLLRHEFDEDIDKLERLIGRTTGWRISNIE